MVVHGREEIVAAILKNIQHLDEILTGPLALDSPPIAIPALRLHERKHDADPALHRPVLRGKLMVVSGKLMVVRGKLMVVRGNS